MSSHQPPPQTTAPREDAPTRTHPPAAGSLGPPGAAPARDRSRSLPGPGSAGNLAASREHDANEMTSSSACLRPQNRRRSGAYSVPSGASSGRLRRSRQDSVSTAPGAVASSDPRRDSAPPGDARLPMNSQPDLQPVANASDVSARVTRRISAPAGLPSQLNAGRSAVRRVSMQVEDPEVIVIQASSDKSNKAYDFFCIFRSLRAAAGRCPQPRQDSSGAVAVTSSRDRAFSSTWVSTADNTASSAVRLAHETVKGLQRWSSFRHPPVTSDDTNVPPTSKEQPSDVNKILRVSSIVALFILAAVLVAILLLQRSPHTSGDEKTVCSAADCTYHVHVLGLNRSRTVTPCDDFGRFVCSGWDNRYRDISFTVQTDAIMDWITRLTQSSRRAKWTARVTGRPLNMMRVCIEGSSSEENAVRQFVSFVEGRTFSWPTVDWQETTLVQPWLPLQALLELAVLWGLPLWFRVDLPASHREDRISLVISPSPFPSAFGHLHSRFLRYADVYPYYVQEFIDIVFSHRPAAPAFETFIQNSVHMQGHVFGNMTAAAAAPYFAPRVVVVENLQSVVKNVSAEDWIMALRTVNTTPLKMDSLVLAANENILTAMDALFGAYTARDVWFHTVWWFAQAVGLAAVNSLFSDLKNHPLGKTLKSIVCAIHVDASYSALLAANYKSHLNVNEQHTIGQLFDNIRLVAVEKVRSSTMRTSPGRSALATLLGNTQSVIWPQHGFDSTEALESLYGSGYRKAESFFGEWLWSRQQIQRARLSRFAHRGEHCVRTAPKASRLVQRRAERDFNVARLCGAALLLRCWH
ncbi:hypothetical protein HPB50_009419 [Hyalomma asiaticum]|uniref:Uncharacterized protein n=1 Tax=Hyalomma asiaticum TaxID=266040 RepID=A0ACB7RWH5_HYAAI|nr:hypothetical protein HPB50_009419 [Hyalomma asiaticum]